MKKGVLWELFMLETSLQLTRVEEQWNQIQYGLISKTHNIILLISILQIAGLLMSPQGSCAQLLL